MRTRTNPNSDYKKKQQQISWIHQICSRYEISPVVGEQFIIIIIRSYSFHLIFFLIHQLAKQSVVCFHILCG